MDGVIIFGGVISKPYVMLRSNKTFSANSMSHHLQYYKIFRIIYHANLQQIFLST